MKTQVELVDTLEHRLTKERNKLQAMMHHLQMKHSPDTTTPTVGKIEPASPMHSPTQQEMVSPIQTAVHSVHQTSQLPQPQVAAVPQPMQQLSPTVTACAVNTATPIQVSLRLFGFNDSIRKIVFKIYNGRDIVCIINFPIKT